MGSGRSPACDCSRAAGRTSEPFEIHSWRSRLVILAALGRPRFRPQLGLAWPRARYCRAMSQENMEIVLRAFDANRSGPPDATVEAAVALANPRIEFRSRLTSVEGSTYRGHDGVRRYFADMADAWQEWRNEVIEIREVSPDAVLSELTFRGTGRSGVDVELRSAIVWVFAEGKVLQMHAYPTPEGALEAAGLSE